MRTSVYDRIQQVLRSHDLLVTPTLAALPVDNADDGNTVGPSTIEGVDVDPLIGWCLTYVVNFTGHPAASVPAGDVDGLPVGMQLIGRRYGDADVLAASATYERLRPWQWETDRGPQYLAYDAWWHLNQNTLVSSEWGTPSIVEDGLVPELLLDNEYGHRIHFWDLAEGRHLQEVDLGPEHQMVLELRPSHDPDATWGFVGVVVSTADLSASVWRWHRDGDRWTADQVITIPAEPADPDDLPPALKPFSAVPPLVTDIDLSVDDRMLYVSCWGIGELKQYDVSDPAHPREVGSVHLGGVVRKTAHPAAPGEPLAGGPQMVEVSRDGRRIYVTNSLYGAWDDQFFPDGTGSWMAKIDTDPGTGGLSLDQRFFPHGEDWRGLRPHQVRLQGGDASSDSYCYR